MKQTDRPGEALEIRPTGAALGAVIEGVDLAAAMSDHEFQQIEAALHQYGVLVFPQQRINDAQQIRFSRLFGAELDIHAMRHFASADHPEVFILSNIIENGKPIGAVDAAQYWHSDLCYTPRPSRVTILYGVEIPTDAAGRPLGATEFASTVASYEALPEDLKRRLHGTTARFVASKKKPSKKPSHFGKLDAETSARLEEYVVHPVVRTHPYTGAKALYVNPGFTTEICEFSPEESERTLDFLFRHMTEPRFIYRHAWSVGDVVICDHALCIHQGTGDYELPQRRLLRRTMVKGSVPA